MNETNTQEPTMNQNQLERFTEHDWGQRVRKALMFGHHPDIADLIELWHAATGEKLELGKRCLVCNGEGRRETGFVYMTNPPRPQYKPCSACKDATGFGTGYEVQPTWMEEHKAAIERAD